MKQITVSDVTIKQLQTSREYSLSFKEKIELAKLVDRLHADVIELEGLSGKKAFEALYRLDFSAASRASADLAAEWRDEKAVAARLKQ